jgi:hypothetical protein
MRLLLNLLETGLKGNPLLKDRNGLALVLIGSYNREGL